MKKVVSNLTNVICVVFLLWLALSYVEIVCKNVRPNPQYSNYNFLIRVTGYQDKLLEIN